MTTETYIRRGDVARVLGEAIIFGELSPRVWERLAKIPTKEFDNE